MVKKVEKNNMGNNALYCVGVSPLVKDKEAVFLTDLEEIAVVDPKDVKLVIDGSSFSEGRSCIWKVSGGSRSQQIRIYISEIRRLWT